MTSLIEKAVSFLAPHHCITCGIEDNIVCDGCLNSQILPLLSACCLCGRPTKDWATCPACARRSSLSRIYATTAYDGLITKVIHRFKFERAKETYKPLVQLLHNTLPMDDWYLVPVPTAPARVRQRGYDQAELLARGLACQRQLPYLPVLIRDQDVRQLGASRVQRLERSTKMFLARPHMLPQGAKVLLVDDVCTTGATLSAAAQCLRLAGAGDVSAAVVAWRQ